VLFQA
jgi:hypothetical protein